MEFIFSPKNVATPDEYITALLEGYYDVHLPKAHFEQLFDLLNQRKNEHPVLMYNYAKLLLKRSSAEEELAFAALVELARQKFTPAINALAYCYRYGHGVEKSIPRSDKCLKLAMEQDFLPAFFNAAKLASQKHTCPGFCAELTQSERIDLVYAYLKKAIARDFYPAKILYLRLFYEWHDRNFSDPFYAELCQQLAEDGEYEAQHLLGKFYFTQRGKHHTKEERTELERKALYWQKQAAEAGFIAAQMSLAAHYFADETDYGGLDTKKSMEDAIHWWQKAAEQGSKAARFNIGFCYETGTVLPQSFEKAAEYYCESSLYSPSQNNLAVFYLLGQGVKRSLENAIDLWKDAIEGITEDMLSDSFFDVYPTAFYNLAQCYENGYGVEKSWTKAQKLYKKALISEFPDAIYRMAAYYELGINVTQSHTKAERLLDKLRNKDLSIYTFDQAKYEDALATARKTSHGIYLSPLSFREFQEVSLGICDHNYSQYTHSYKGHQRLPFQL